MLEKYSGDSTRLSMASFMENHGLTVNSWCGKAKIDEGTLRKFLNHKTDSLTHKTLSKLASAVHSSVEEITGEGEQEQEKTVPLVGYIGGGAFYPIDDSIKGAGLDEAPVPILSRKDVNINEIVAVKIKGDSMQPFYPDGTTVYYSKKQHGIESSAYNRICVAGLADGGITFKLLRRINNKPVLFCAQNLPFEGNVVWAVPPISIEPPK